jgi:hypothetical protein
MALWKNKKIASAPSANHSGTALETERSAGPDRNQNLLTLCSFAAMTF